MFSVSVNVVQPIVITGTLEQSANCESGLSCLGDLVKIENIGTSDRIVKLTASQDDNIVTSFVGKLGLSTKDTSTWELTDTKATVYYTLVGNEFVYEADLPTDYVLIYYKDAVVGLDGRLANPQPVVELVSSIGNLAQSDDANLNADYSQAPDSYLHKTGAKLWAVPNSAILSGNVLDWSQWNSFLYETDLITYFANGNGEIVVPAGSFIEFYPQFSVDTYTLTGEYPITITVA